MTQSLFVMVLLLIPFPSSAQTGDFAAQLQAQVPKLAFLKAHDPAAFARIVEIYENGRRSGKSTDQMVGEARATFAREQADRTAAAPDALVLQAFGNTIAVTRDLERQSPKRCAALLSGGNAGDIKPYLSPATVAAEDAFYEAVFSYTPSSHPPAATEDEEKLFVGAALGAEARTAKLAPPAFVQRAMASPAAFCALQRALLERERRTPNAAALFRRRLEGAAVRPQRGAQ